MPRTRIMQHCKHESIWWLPTSLMPVLQHSLRAPHAAMHSASFVARDGSGEGRGGDAGVGGLKEDVGTALLCCATPSQ